jgi:hypothetical protein
VLAEKMLQFKIPATHSVRVPAVEVQGFRPYRPPRAAAIFGHEENNGLHDSPRADWPCGERGDGRKEPTG